MTRASSHSFDDAELAELKAGAEGLDAEAVLRWATERFGDRLAVATSFGAEDMVLLDMLARQKEDTGRIPRVFTLDTGRLPEETLQLLDRVRIHYKLDIEVYFPDAAAVEAMVNQRGPYSFFDSVEARKACCHVRKVVPLQRALAGAGAWITGLRREQAPTRSGLEVVEQDEGSGLYKLSPLTAWSEADVWRYLAENKVPTHKLHDEGYPSIGCAPCTRAVAGWRKPSPSSPPGERVDIRAGRWWWESPDHKECGLHELPSADEDHAAPEGEENDNAA